MHSHIFLSGAEKEQIETASKTAANAKKKLDKAFETYDKESLGRVSAMSLEALKAMFTMSNTQLNDEILENKSRIRELEAERQRLVNENIGDPSDMFFGDILPPGMSKAKKGGTPATGSRGVSAASKLEDYFTAITVEVSSKHENSSSSQHSVDTASKTSFSLGLFSAQNSNSYHKSTFDAQTQMASSNVRVSFECMRVDIHRTWLRPELFFDYDLRAAPGA